MTRDIVLCMCVMPACSVRLHLTVPADCLVRVYGLGAVAGTASGITVGGFGWFCCSYIAGTIVGGIVVSVVGALGDRVVGGSARIELDQVLALELALELSIATERTR